MPKVRNYELIIALKSKKSGWMYRLKTVINYNGMCC